MPTIHLELASRMFRRPRRQLVALLSGDLGLSPVEPIHNPLFFSYPPDSPEATD